MATATRMQMLKDSRGYYWRAVDIRPSEINTQSLESNESTYEEPISPGMRDVLSNLDEYELARDRGQLENYYQDYTTWRNSMQAPNVGVFTSGRGQLSGHSRDREGNIINPSSIAPQHVGPLNPNQPVGLLNPNMPVGLLNPNQHVGPLNRNLNPNQNVGALNPNQNVGLLNPNQQVRPLNLNLNPSQHVRPHNPNWNPSQHVRPHNPNLNPSRHVRPLIHNRFYGQAIPTSFVPSLPTVSTSIPIGTHFPSSSPPEMQTLMGEAQSFASVNNPNQTQLTSFDIIMRRGTEILNKLKADAAAGVPYQPYRFDAADVLRGNTELLRLLKEAIEPTRSPENQLSEAPRSPENELSEALRSPEKDLSEAPRSPEKDLSEAPRSPGDELSEAPRSPEKDLSEAPRSPENELSEAPRSPENDLSEAPRSPENELSEAPRSPENELSEAP